MNYIIDRIENFEQFFDIINDPRSRQCGDTFLLHVDGQDIVPVLRELGRGVYGITLGVEDPELEDKGLNVVIKISSSSDHRNAIEIFYSLMLSNLVRNGGVPNFPLFSKCQPRIGDDIMDCDCGEKVDEKSGCTFENNVFISKSGDIRLMGNQQFLHSSQRSGCLLSFSDRMDFSLRDFLENSPNSDEDMLYLLCSITSQLILAFKELYNRGLSHNDTHIGNILLKTNITDDFDLDTIKYVVNNDGETDTYYVKHENVFAVLADFGFMMPSRTVVNNVQQIGNDMDDMLPKWFGEGCNFSDWQRSSIYDMARYAVSLEKGVQLRLECRAFASVIADAFIELLDIIPNQVAYDPMNFFMVIDDALYVYPNIQNIWRETTTSGLSPDSMVLSEHVVSDFNA
jgi:hypothetical protein